MQLVVAVAVAASLLVGQAKRGHCLAPSNASSMVTPGSCRVGRVRLIGVDTPETKHPQKRVEQFGRESSEFLKRLAQGQRVTIEFDNHRLHDRYGRLLAYLYLSDGRSINAEIIRQGYGSPTPPTPSNTWTATAFWSERRGWRGVDYGLKVDSADDRCGAIAAASCHGDAGRHPGSAAHPVAARDDQAALATVHRR